MKSLVIIISFVFQLTAFAQKKPIAGLEIMGGWPRLNNDGILSNDGRFIAYTIENFPVGFKSLVIQNTAGTWERQIISKNFNNVFYFSSNSKSICYQKDDSLFIKRLGNDASVFFQTSLYKCPNNNRGQWIAFKEKGKTNDLHVLNLNGNKKFVYHDIEDAFFEDGGNTLLLEESDKKNDITTLQCLYLENQKKTTVWSGKGRIVNYRFDHSGQQIAFLVKDSLRCQVYLYKKGLTSAVERTDNRISLLLDSLQISQIDGFTRNGKWLLVTLRKEKVRTFQSDQKKVSVDVWTYRDDILYPQQSASGLDKVYNIVFSTEKNTPGVLLNQDGLQNVYSAEGLNGGFAVLSSDTIANREAWWTHSPKPKQWLVSFVDGSRALLPFSSKNFQISPASHWIIFWANRGNRFDYFSYEIATGKTRNITSSIPVSFAMERMPTLDSVQVGIAGWLKDDVALIAYDNYDIWKIDPSGQRKPLNLTGGFGSKNYIKLRLLQNEDAKFQETIINEDIDWLLSGFNEQNKYNGFLRLKPGKGVDPEILSMNPFSWYKKESQIGNSAMGANLQTSPIERGKSENHGWLLMGESATEYPNYYYTKDLKQFRPISNLAPQKKYEWLTTELVTWKTPQGQMIQGVLYKPENFDSTKKYPILFNYYERYTGWMYSFRMPGATSGRINIPWFVSQDYLVFTPDIYFSNGYLTGISTGEDAYNSVISAAEFLIKRPYIDKNKMGIQGHSFGGFLTNYLLTHSNLFAAAAEGAGFTDEMSSYLTLVGGGFIGHVDFASAQSHKENDHALYGSTPWERPDLYRKNSPVWDADKASAPLLILHNKNDEQVQWRQGVEMYMALRRLGKPCWMLQYDKGGHGVSGKDAVDYTVRLTQFFDHYLKSAPAPIWMTQGIPARLKGVITGYDYDPAGNCGKDCKVCKMWNEKMRKDSAGTWREIQEKEKTEHWMGSGE